MDDQAPAIDVLSGIAAGARLLHRRPQHAGVLAWHQPDPGRAPICRPWGRHGVAAIAVTTATNAGRLASSCIRQGCLSALLGVLRRNVGVPLGCGCGKQIASLGEHLSASYVAVAVDIVANSKTEAGLAQKSCQNFDTRSASSSRPYRSAARSSVVIAGFPGEIGPMN